MVHLYLWHASLSPGHKRVHLDLHITMQENNHRVITRVTNISTVLHVHCRPPSKNFRELYVARLRRLRLPRARLSFVVLLAVGVQCKSA